VSRSTSTSQPTERVPNRTGPAPEESALTPAPGPLPHPLTEPDVEILRLLARGLPVETVARRLEISDRTVRRRCRQVCDRLGVHTPIEAVVWAAHHYLV
jgi:DNA-binding NarL/FixJ family response regulator